MLLLRSKSATTRLFLRHLLKPCQRSLYTEPSPSRHFLGDMTVKTMRWFDRANISDRLIYRCAHSTYLTGGKWLVLGILCPVTFYTGCKELYGAFKEKEQTQVHPSQRNIKMEIGPVEAAMGLCISVIFASALLLLSRVTVRRIYVCDNSDTFIIIMSRLLIGNKKIRVKPGQVSTNEHPLFNHKIGNRKVYINNLSGFQNAMYYHNLLGRYKNSWEGKTVY